MKKIALLLVFLVSVSGIASAQIATGSVSGKIQSASVGKPLAFATVVLLNSTDSSLVKGALTDSAGEYVIEDIPAGEYVIAVTLGNAKKYSSTFHVREGEKAIVERLAIESNSKKLKEVTVTAQKPIFEQKPGMMVVNVENSVTNMGNSAMDVLRKSPGVSIDGDENISLKGKQGVVVMIDDKPTYMSSADLANMLKSLPASAISKIELMTIPPARYDAAGTAGIINIRLKKNTNYGLNGSATAVFKMARYPYYNPGVNFNYRTKKVYLFGLYNYSLFKSYSDATLTRKYYNGDTLNTVFDQTRHSTFEGDNHIGKFGMDYFFNPKNAIGFVATGLFNKDKRRVENLTNVNNPFNELQTKNMSDIRYKYNFNNTTYNLNYRSILDSAGTKITFDADYAAYKNRGNMNSNTDYFDAENNVVSNPGIWRGRQPSDINIKSFKTDFVHPMKDNMKLETGLKTSFVHSDNTLFFENLLNGVYVVDTGITNHFIYDENINAAYISLSKEFKAFSIQVGLRGEQTIVKGNQVTTDSIFRKNYFQVFPTVFISKTINKNNELSLSYARRIDRPDYQSLNPFRYYVDPLTYKGGNTRLLPQITDAIEISHTFKGMYVTTLNLNRVSDVMTEILKQVDSNKATIQYKENMSRLYSYTLSFSIPVQVTKWWSVSNMLYVYYEQYKGQYLDGPLNRSSLDCDVRTQNQFILGSNTVMELSAYYRSGGIYAALDELSSGSVSVGLKQSFWNKRANIKIDVNDIFFTQRFKGTERFQNIDLKVLHRWESREFSIAFTYQFGNKNVRAGNRRSGIEDEQQRVKKADG